MSDKDKAISAAVESSETEADAKKISAEKQEALAKKLSGGKLALGTPIRAGGADVTELDYDFNKITGWEYAEAMDCDKAAPNVFVMTSKQALSLFAKAAGKATKGIDETDIRERLSALDAMEAVQLTMLFFRVSAQIRSRRTYSA